LLDFVVHLLFFAIIFLDLLDLLDVACIVDLLDFF